MEHCMHSTETRKILDMSVLGRVRGPFSFILELAQFQLMADKNGEREREREDTLEALFNSEEKAPTRE